METNTSIIGRQVLSIGDRKVIGKVNGYHVNCDSLSVEYLLVASNATKSTVALPLKKIIAAGDTYVTVQSMDDLCAADDKAAAKIVQKPYELKGCPAFSRLGNKLADVASFEFCSKTGKVVKITLADKTEFVADKFIFFQPEFVFFEDPAAPQKAEKKPAAKKPAAKKAVKKAAKPAAKKAAAKKPAPQAATEDKDAKSKQALMGRVLTSTVISKDGVFTAEKGTKLDAAILDEAAKHDALTSMLMSVDL